MQAASGTDVNEGTAPSVVEQELLKETGDVQLVAPWGWIFSAIALVWSLFQLWIASPVAFLSPDAKLVWGGLVAAVLFVCVFFLLGASAPRDGEVERNKLSPVVRLVAAVAIAVLAFVVLQAKPVVGVQARGLHLMFAFLLCFIAFGWRYVSGTRRPNWVDVLLGLAGAVTASYQWWGYAGLSDRAGELLTHELFGMTIPTDVLIGGLGILVLLEAVRRSIGLPLVILGLLFFAYSVFGQSMPDLISHKGVSLSRLAGYHWLTSEGVFGIALDVSTRFIFLFVLFGAILDRAGAGAYFIDLAFALVGKYRGGPAKAAVLASGMTGMISGSSIANTVTTGTFTIPVMKKSGVPAVKAGAFEVAASVNGQIMPPIMGAAAFVIAEFVGIPYFDVVKHAAIPAVISYLALFYITDLESQRLGLKSMRLEDIPRAGKIFWRGAHYLLPIVVLVYLLMVERMTAGTSVFYATMLLILLVLIQEIVVATKARASLLSGLQSGLLKVTDGLIMGAKNMIGVAIAVAGAGIIVGAVASTGLSNALSGVVETLAGNNVYLLLGLVAVLSIILGMGLPTTANYLVVASLMAPVIVEVGGAQGLVLPLIAVHLFVFYFGLMADVTPPVGLASYAAAGISRADPIKTGVQAFIYSIRTAILPFIFIFNLDLLLIGIAPGWLGWLQGIGIFLVSLAAILAFTSLTFRHMFTTLNIGEMVLLAVACVALFRPDFLLGQVYPKFLPVEAAQVAKGVSSERLRLHVTRQSEYGERRRLFVFDKQAGKDLTWTSMGLQVASKGDGLSVTEMPAFLSPAEKLSVEAGDQITRIDVEQANRPAKEWVYIPAFLALLLAVLWNRSRSLKGREDNPMPLEGA